MSYFKLNTYGPSEDSIKFMKRMLIQGFFNPTIGFIISLILLVFFIVFFCHDDYKQITNADQTYITLMIVSFVFVVYIFIKSCIYLYCCGFTGRKLLH
jgi:biotin transporter BioY